ncbi:hypothetical protein AB0C28_31765 [Nonomuraea sp. NPDC048892]|uniref:hypothetical protein n=1 Tax=Nonomuraea sp. NPDC048892 TaxID=3154624 RepID=UPI0033D61013
MPDHDPEHPGPDPRRQVPGRDPDQGPDPRLGDGPDPRLIDDLEHGADGPGPARSLVEAYVYLDLVAPGGSEQAAVADGSEGWLVRAGGVEVLVPYEAEETARQAEATFGTGLSALLDPGQWVLVASTYASRALEGGLLLAEDPSDPEGLDTVAADWSFAADAIAEALKFVPEGDAGADGPDPESFWTEMGRSARDAAPGRFTRAKLESDLAFYRQNLADLHRLHAD